MPVVEAIALIAVIALAVAAMGLAFGMVVIAPRIARGLDHADPPDNAEDGKEPGDRPD